MMNSQNARQTRFEPAVPYPQEKIGQDNSGSSGSAGGHGNFSHHVGNQPQFRPEQNQLRRFPTQNGNNGNRNQQRNGQRGNQQNWQQSGQQNFRDPQNNRNYCPPHGDPAGERRNTPGQGSRQENRRQNERNGNFSAGNFLPAPAEDHFHNEIHSNSGDRSRSPGFPDLFADNEKLMILLLIYLLMKEKADIKLILALGYLLL